MFETIRTFLVGGAKAVVMSKIKPYLYALLLFVIITIIVIKRTKK